MLFIVLFASAVSAEIIVEQQPAEIYNLGDLVSVPITIKALGDISGSFEMDLICTGSELNFYKNGINLPYGEEIKLAPAPSLVLTTDIIGDRKGDCKIRAKLGEEISLTNEFSISDSLRIAIIDKETNFAPGTSFSVEGEAIKESGKAVEGFVDLEIVIELGVNKTETLAYKGSVNGGFFAINVTLPEDTKAGNHLLKIKAYEKDFNGEITNRGFTDYSVHISQVPTSLEIFLENTVIEPGTNLAVKAILHDQTGENIEAIAIITIKNEKDKILEQTDKNTDEFLEYEIPYNQPPTQWTLVAVSHKLDSQLKFNISEKQEVKVFLVNKTVVATNMGNVPYCNKTILIKIGNDSLNLEPCLEVDETKKYLLTAPDGEYEVEIIKEGESIISENILLTGNAISAKETGRSVLSIVRLPAVWIFLILILGVIAVIIFKKGYKRSFIGGYLKKKGNPSTQLEKPAKKISFGKKPFISITNKGELSLSIKGNKQDASVVCLNLKNYKEYQDGKGNVSETLQKIVHLAEAAKVFIYQNQENLFFIFAPVKTKTFKNEKPALKLAQKIKEILDSHNKLFKQKMNYGVALNYGEIVAKDADNTLKFAPMKNLMTVAKKVAGLSKEKVLLSEDGNTRFGGDVKTQKHTLQNTTVHEVKELIDRSEHAAFISTFLHKLEKEKKK